MNKWLLALIFTAVIAVPLGASPLSCGSMTLDLLEGLGTSGCLAQDVIFSNFSYSHIGPATPVLASQIMANLVSDANPLTGDRHGWIFSGPAQGWSSGTFVLSYTVEVLSRRPFVTAQLQTVNNPPWAEIGINEQLNINGTPADLDVWFNSDEDQHLTDFERYALPGYRQFQVVDTGTPRNGAITRFDNYFYQTPSDIPEPAAQVLTGSALLALSLCLKRFKRS